VLFTNKKMNKLLFEFYLSNTLLVTQSAYFGPSSMMICSINLFLLNLNFMLLFF